MSLLVIPQPGLVDNDTPRIQDRRYRLRHLGRAEIIVLRDDDVMRAGLRVKLHTISSGMLGIVSPVRLLDREQIKVRLRNDVQRFHTEMRGAVRGLEPTADGNFHIDIELFARLMPLDVMMLRRAGMSDVTTYAGPIWV